METMNDLIDIGIEIQEDIRELKRRLIVLITTDRDVASISLDGVDDIIIPAISEMAR